MKKILSILFMGSMAISAMATIRYCDPASTKTTGQAASWATAISPATLRKSLGSIKENDTICIKGGTILITQLSEVFNVSKSFTIIGGFDPNTTEPFTQLPTYPSATPTIFSGDVNNNGIPDKGDAVSLMRVDYSGDYTKVLHLIGCDFATTYYDGEEDSPNDVLTSTAKCAALRVLCGTAFVRYCNFYDHVTPNGRGSQCVTSVGAKLHMTDCELRDGVCMTRGGLLRLRQYFPNNPDTAGAINPDCVLERCALYNGNNMGGDTLNTAGFYGGAIQVSYGPFFAINTTIANSKGYSDGGGLNANKSGATLISCTLANSRCQRAYKEDEAAASKNTYGSNFHISEDGELRIANSIVLGPDDNGTKQYAALYSGPNTITINDNCISGGYNITGTYFYYKNGVEENNQTFWLATDKSTTPKGTTVQRQEDYLGANPQMSDNGGFSKTIKPLAMQDGDNVAHLQQLADQWCPKWTKVDASVDQRGYQRDDQVTCVGAVAMESTSALEETQSSIINHQSAIYNILGQPVDASYKGIIIQKGKKYLVQ